MPEATPGEGPGGPARSLFLEQTAARRAEKIFFATAPPSPPPPTPAYLWVWMTALDPPLKAVSVSGVSGFRFV